MLSGSVVNAQLAAAVGDPANPPQISPGLLSSLALDQLNSAETDAIKNVNGLKESFGNGVSTSITIFNATGGDLNLATSVDQHGHIGQEPYDSIIRNGQASGVLHVKTSGAATGSTGMVAYSIELDNLFFVLVWINPFNHAASSPKAKAYIQSEGQFNKNRGGDPYFANTDSSGSSGGEYRDQPTPIRAQWTIGNETSPHLRVILSRFPNQ